MHKLLFWTNSWMIKLQRQLKSCLIFPLWVLGGDLIYLTTPFYLLGTKDDLRADMKGTMKGHSKLRNFRQSLSDVIWWYNQQYILHFGNGCWHAWWSQNFDWRTNNYVRFVPSKVEQSTNSSSNTSLTSTANAVTTESQPAAEPSHAPLAHSRERIKKNLIVHMRGRARGEISHPLYYCNSQSQ